MTAFEIWEWVSSLAHGPGRLRTSIYFPASSEKFMKKEGNTGQSKQYGKQALLYHLHKQFTTPNRRCKETKEQNIFLVWVIY